MPGDRLIVGNPVNQEEVREAGGRRIVLQVHDAIGGTEDPQSRPAGVCPVTGERRVAWVAEGYHVVGGRNAIAVRVRQIEDAGGRAVDADGINAVRIPVTGYRGVSRIAEHHAVIREAR